MKIAYFDPIGGASGDMIVASLLDAGVSLTALQAELDTLRLGGFSVRCAKVAPRHLAATRFVVEVDDPGSGHHHEHDPQHGRHLSDIEEIIADSGLSDEAKSKAIRVFRRLGAAEASVHDTTIDRVHFHEVGAVDSIVDIVSACIGLETLGIKDIYAGPLPLSHGIVRCAHGEWPIPGPAVTKLLAGFQWRQTAIEGELVTPTAAAILAELGRPADSMPPISLEATGYGAGEHDYGIPNVLRICIGESSDLSDEALHVTEIETSLDDQNPELLDHVMDSLFRAGALDVWFTPIQMKKNRPAVQLSALSEPENAESLAAIILRETSTLGVRFKETRRLCLERETRTVATASGEVRVKLARLPDGQVKAAPEYDDVKRLATDAGRPAREIYLEAQLAALSLNTS